MKKEFEASKPIYMQIMDQVFLQIARGELKPGEKLPSVREMAIQAGVNPNTIQRSYAEMERMGVVETKRGQGTFVIDSKEIVSALKQTLQQQIIAQFVSSMEELGFTENEIISALDRYLKGRD